MQPSAKNGYGLSNVSVRKMNDNRAAYALRFPRRFGPRFRGFSTLALDWSGEER